MSQLRFRICAEAVVSLHPHPNFIASFSAQLVPFELFFLIFPSRVHWIPSPLSINRCPTQAAEDRRTHRCTLFEEAASDVLRQSLRRNILRRACYTMTACLLTRTHENPTFVTEQPKSVSGARKKHVTRRRVPSLFPHF